MTNPFGSGDEEDEAKKLAEQKPAPELAAQQIMGFVKQRQAHDARHRPKPKSK